MTDLQLNLRELTNAELALVIGGAVPIATLLREAIASERERVRERGEEQVTAQPTFATLWGWIRET